MTKTTARVMALAIGTLPSLALADDALAYRSEGGCAGDFERIELKSYWLRIDSSGGGHASSMIYDHAEKLAWFIDHGSHTFMQTELDEDAIDLQADIMKSLRTKMRRESGFDPFEMAKSLCPGVGAAGSRDRQPDEPIDCGNGTTLGGPGGKQPSSEEMMAAMKNGQAPALDPATQQMMQKMMEQQLAKMTPEQRAQMQQMMVGNGGSMMMPAAPAGAAPQSPAPPKPERIDRDAGEADVGGIKCMRREHLRAGELVREDCYASADGLHLGDVETRRIARFTNAVRSWSRSLVPDSTQPEADNRVLVRRICYTGGHESGRATLAIDTAPISESRFEVPAGYKPLDLMGSEGRRGGD